MKTNFSLFLLIVLLMLSPDNIGISAQSSAPADRPKPVEVSQDVENWSYPHYHDNRLVWEGKGEKAHITGETEVVAEKFQLLYHYQSKNATAGEELIRFKAEQGLINRANNEAIFREDVIVKTESPVAAEDNPANGSASRTELKTPELFMNLTTQVISSTVQTVLSQPDLIITGTGLTAEINLGLVKMHREILTFIEGSNLSSFSLYPVVLDVPPEQKKQVEITVTCAGPLSVEKINSVLTNPTQQKINFKNNVVLVKQTLTAPLLAETKLYADELEIILINRPVSPTGPVIGGTDNDTQKTESVISRLIASGHVRIEDGTTNAFCHQVDWDESTQRVTFWGGNEQMARITRDTLNAIRPNDSGPDKIGAGTKPEPAITLQAQEIENFSADDIFILKGKKEAIFFNQENKPAPNDFPEIVPPGRAGQFNKIHVTAKNNAVVSLKTYRASFKNKVRVIQKNEPDETAGQPVDFQSVMKADRLILTLDSQRNEIKNACAWGNILITNKDGSRIIGKIFEWEPAKNIFKIKSDYLVKAWHQNQLIKAHEIIVHTASKTGGQFGNWSQIEAKNKNGTPGTIEIRSNPPRVEKEN
ncbi:MAG: LPS export ABC transporter periplasmic protein LptC [Planctomycetota bacterium]